MAMTNVDRQIHDQIVGEFTALIRAQKPMPDPAFNAPTVAATWTMVRICGTKVFDSSGRLWADLGESRMSELLSLRAPDRSSTHYDRSDYWKQYADQFDLDPTDYNTNPEIILLPAQPIIGAESESALLGRYIA